MPFIAYDLNPYKGKNYNTNVPVNDTPSSDYEGQFQSKKVRSIGTACPIVFVGWGYDLYGRPVPSEYKYTSEMNVNSSHEQYAAIRFSGGASCPNGGTVPRAAYKAGPLDIRWDPHGGLWKTDHTFYAEIVGTGVTLNNLNGDLDFYTYQWKEISPSFSAYEGLQDQVEVGGTNLSIFRDYNDIHSAQNVAASGWGKYNNVAINSANYGVVGSSPVPNGSIVKMRANISSSDNPDVRGVMYEFSYYGQPSPLFARIFSSQSFSDAGLNSQTNRYIYTIEIGSYNQTSLDFTLSGGGFRYAINTVETNNPETGVMHPGTNTDGPSYPNGFLLNPISNGTIVKIEPLGIIYGGASSPNLYSFTLTNVHDGTC